MVRCSVIGCKSDSGTKMPGLSFHSFPEQCNLRRNWITATGRTDWSPKPSSKICCKHFENEMLFKKKKLTLLLPNAVPILMKETSGPSPKFRVQMSSDPTPASQGPGIVEVKTESDPIKPDEDPNSEEEALLFDENPDPSDDDQTNEDLVPLSAHPVPLSNAPDPLCDVKIKEEEINEAAEEGEGTVKEEDRSVGGMPSGLLRQGDGAPLRGVLPPTAEVFQIRKMEQKMKNLTRRSERDRKNVHNLVNRLRRRDMKVNELQEQVEALRRFVFQQHGAEVVEQLIGAAGKTDGMSKKIYRLMVKRRDERISELQTELETLRDAARAHGESQRGSGADAPGTQIYSIKKDERMKKANRQLLIIERDNRQKSSDTRQKSVHSTSDIQQKSSVQGKAEILQKSSVIDGNTSEIRQKILIDTKPTCLIEEKNPFRLEHTPRKSVKNIDILKNPLVVMQPILDSPQMPSVGAKRKLEVRPKYLPIKPKPVIPQIGNKRKKDIRKNDEKRRVVIQPKLVVRQEMSSDIPQTCVGLQRTSDIRQNALVIQIDGMQNTVIQPKLVRLEESTMDIG